MKEIIIQQKQKNVYPLVENGIMENYILEWAKTQPIFNDYYKYNKRCGCMWCPMASMTNHAYLLMYYPDEYEKMMQLARDTELMRERANSEDHSVFGRVNLNTIRTTGTSVFARSICRNLLSV